MSEAISIRKFAPGDRAMVQEFFNQMGGETRALFNRGGWNERNAMKFFDGDTQHSTYFAATVPGDGGELMVGYLFLWDIHTSIPWLGVAVREEYKGQGLGRRLMTHAADYARSLGAGGILLTTSQANLRAQALYERMGYMRMGVHNYGEVLYLLRFAVRVRS